MYTDIDDPNLPTELFRKEYASLKSNAAHLQPLSKERWNESTLDNNIIRDGKLQLQTYQKFPALWINPNNTNMRLLLKFDTGTGKTVTVLTIAMNFIQKTMETYRVWEQDKSPEVFIIGFSRHIFIRELMKRPEFGFITREEIAREHKLRTAAMNGSVLEREELSKFHTEIKKRFTKKSMGGFLRFYGYKEFFNRLFIFTIDGLTKLAALLKIDALDRSSLTEQQILLGLEKRLIGINYDLLDALTNSAVLCDEFHHVYNAVAINNYGIAIRIALAIHDRPDIMQRWIPIDQSRMQIYKSSAVRAVFMTATPINNSPTEIIDLLNILVKLGRIQQWYKDHNAIDWAEKIRLEKDDFFDGRVMRKNTAHDIAWLIQGSVSYLSDTNPAYFPTYSFDGETIKIPKSLLSSRLSTYGGTTIPYLKFIRCEMSPLHYKTYLSVFQGTLPPDGQSLIDMVLPSPVSDIGIFKTRDIKQILKSAPAAWKAKHKIDVVKQNIGNNVLADCIVGEFMRLNTLRLYAMKYTTMMEHVITNLKSDAGKIVINHQNVRGSGVLFLEEILRVNGILDEFSEPVTHTLCSKCGKPHSSPTSQQKSIDHAFVPARFVVMHSDIDSSAREHSKEKFKHVNNLDGYLYRIMLGSQIINESVDLSEVREIKIMTVPDDIATIIQIIGRAIRKWSHIRLPPHKRSVAIQIYTSALPEHLTANDLSYEERRYLEKSMDYITIQEIDKIINSEAIDGPFNYDIINPAKSDEKALGHLPYEISPRFGKWRGIVHGNKPLTPAAITNATWEIFYGNDEVAIITYAIKRLFIEQSRCWKYDDLWFAVQEPPFDMNINTRLFDEESFVLALDFLVDENSISTGVEFGNKSNHSMDSLFNSLDKTIHVEGVNSRIVYIQGYYILLPIQQDRNGTDVYGLGKSIMAGLGTPDIDIESWSRWSGQARIMDLNVTRQLQTSNASYEQLKMRFYKAYNKTPIQEFPSSLEIYGVDFHVQLVQDAIRYCFNILTNPDMRFSELHVFYFKLLYFYDKFDLILYCSDLEGTPLSKSYDQYVTKSNIKYGLHSPLGARKKGEKKEILEEDQYNAFLLSSMNKTAGLSKPFNLDRLDAFLGRHKSVDTLKSKPFVMHRIIDDANWIPKAARITKVFSNMLPVGHFMTSLVNGAEKVSIPTLYNPAFYTTKPKHGEKPQEWYVVQKFAEMLESESVENDTIIGYYDQNPSSIELRFKLRAPVHKMVRHEDTRMMERGSVCNTRKKEELLSIVESLGIVPDEDSIRSLCDTIKLELMRKEIIERRRARHTKKTKARIRWFYFHFEKQPISEY
jgi:hypothetical protein